MRKFRLKKTYPGGPKMPCVVIDNGGVIDCIPRMSYENGNTSTIPQSHVVGQPDYWEEIISPDPGYIVLKVVDPYRGVVNVGKGTGFQYVDTDTIHSVQSRSDGHIYTVGENLIISEPIIGIRQSSLYGIVIVTNDPFNNFKKEYTLKDVHKGRPDQQILISNLKNNGVETCKAGDGVSEVNDEDLISFAAFCLGSGLIIPIAERNASEHLPAWKRRREFKNQE